MVDRASDYFEKTIRKNKKARPCPTAAAAAVSSMGAASVGGAPSVPAFGGGGGGGARVGMGYVGGAVVGSRLTEAMAYASSSSTSSALAAISDRVSKESAFSASALSSSMISSPPASSGGGGKRKKKKEKENATFSSSPQSALEAVGASSTGNGLEALVGGGKGAFSDSSSEPVTVRSTTLLATERDDDDDDDAGGAGSEVDDVERDMYYPCQGCAFINVELLNDSGLPVTVLVVVVQTANREDKASSDSASNSYQSSFIFTRLFTSSCKRASRIEYYARGSFVCMQPAASYMSETLAIPFALRKGVASR